MVIPLEEEINALKEKLRANDQLLRKYQAVSYYTFPVSLTTMLTVLNTSVFTKIVWKLIDFIIYWNLKVLMFSLQAPKHDMNSNKLMFVILSQSVITIVFQYILVVTALEGTIESRVLLVKGHLKVGWVSCQIRIKLVVPMYYKCFTNGLRGSDVPRPETIMLQV